MKKLWILLSLLFVIMACNMPMQSFFAAGGQGTPTLASPDIAGTMIARGTIPPTSAVGDYPATPEAVVYAFMNDFQKSPENLTAYLSQARLAQLPKEGPVALLQLQDTLQGFVIQSGTTRMGRAVAMVEVGLKSGKTETRRVFTLVQENGRWVINGIELYQ